MKGDTFTTAMAQRSPLAEAVLAFNFGLAADLHPERMPEGVAGDVARRALAAGSGVRRLSLNLGWALGGVHPAFCFGEFERLPFRVALGSREALNRLVFLLGMAVCRRQIASALTRTAVLALREELGEEDRAFALRRAPFLVSDRDLDRLHVPEDGSLTAETVRACGFRGLAACVQPASAGLVARLRLKLPPAADAFFPADSKAEAMRDVAWSVLRRIALQEAPERWAAFFN